MTPRLLGSSDLAVSPVALGTMSWPGTGYGQSAPELADYPAVRAMVAAALDSGITLFDTAEGYGRGLAEELLGRALEDLDARDRVTVVTKVGPLFAGEKIGDRGCNLSRDHLRNRVAGCLRRLRTDRIDLLLAHWPDPSTPIAETMAAADELRRAGRIRWFGVSNFGPDLLAEALTHGPVAVNQLPYSLVDRSIESDRLPFCLGQRIGIMAYSPLGKGVLSGKYDESHLPPPDDYRHQRPHFSAERLPRNLQLATRLRALAPDCGCTPGQLALAWALARPGITVVLPGAKSPEQVRTNAAAGELTLPAEVVDELTALSAS
jgi:aryl-alcohol dehydrogenase-like predicted oxidoreductase